MSYIPPLNGGRINMTLAGNSTSAGAGYALASTGTVTLAGGNNVTLSQNGNAITISAANGGGAAGTNTLGMSNLGNSAGTSGVITGSNLQMAFAGGNNVTLSQSINASSATITISGPSQTVQTQNLHNLTLAGNSTSAGAGYVHVSSGTLTIAGGDNITLSQNGNAITISGDGGGGAAGTNTLGISNLGNTSGTTGVITGSNMQLAFAGGNNVTLSQSINASSATITISAGDGGGGNTTHATMWFPYNEGVNVAGQAGQASLGFMPVPTPGRAEEVRPDRVVFPLYFTNASNSTGSLTASIWMGLYTRTQSSISLAHSQSTSISLGWAGNNSSSNQRGIRLATMGWTTTIPDARYVVGVVSRTTTGGGNATLSQMLVSQLNSNVSGMWDAASNATVQWPLGVGYYSATTSGLPSSVAYSQINGTNSMAARPPSWHMVSGTA